MRVPIETTAPTPYFKRRLYAITSDHGEAGATQTAVANLMKGWDPNLYLFVGDNAYPSGSVAQTAAAWAVWEDEIADEKVYAALGNHDLDTDLWEPQVNFFTYFPGNRRFYSVRDGNVEFFILNSGYNTAGTMVEPEGNTSTSNQAQWLEQAVKASDAHWKIALFHHPAYTSGVSYSPGKTALRWDWRNLGIDLVISGHSHNYERLIIDGMTYVVAGIGAKTLVGFAASVLSGSQVRDSSHYGAVKVIDSGDELDVEAWSTDSVLMDNFQIIKKPGSRSPNVVESSTAESDVPESVDVSVTQLRMRSPDDGQIYTYEVRLVNGVPTLAMVE